MLLAGTQWDNFFCMTPKCDKFAFELNYSIFIAITRKDDGIGG